MKLIKLSLALLSLFSVGALGCACQPPLSPKKAMKQADAVFVATITKATKTAPNKDGHPDNLYDVTVLQAWKGVKGKHTTIMTGTHSCGYDAEVGTTHLFYATKGASAGWTTTICDRSRQLTQATKEEDLKALGKPKVEFQ